MDPQRITELAKLLRDNGDKILNSEFKLTLSGSLLRALNDSFTLIADSVDIGGPNIKHPNQQDSFQVVKPNNSKSNVFRDLQLVHDFVQKTALLCIVHFPTEHYFEGTIDIGKFRALKRLEVQKTNVVQIIGIQPLRAQLQQLICVKSLHSVDDIITRCGGDNSNGFVWNELKSADFSYNSLQRVDTSLEFAQYLQHLNLRHNKLHSVEAIKWLPHLKSLDLSYNCLQCIPQFHMEAYKRLQLLNISNNYIEDLMGLAKLDALTDLDLSDNCLLDHSYLLPLSALVTLKCLNLYGNPLHYHPKNRLATAQYLHKNTATVKFIMDYEPLAKNEKALTGTHQLRHVGALNRYATRSSSSSINSGRLTSTSSNTPASSVGSLRSFKLQDSNQDLESQSSSGLMVDSFTFRRRSAKQRTVDFDEDSTDKQDDNAKDDNTNGDIAASVTMVVTSPATQQDPMQLSIIDESSADPEHLTTKKHIETLRKKYGAEWLQSGNAEMMQSVLGLDVPQTSRNNEGECENSRQMFNEYLGELSELKVNNSNIDNTVFLPSSTPTNQSIMQQQFDNTLTPIKQPTSNNSSTDKTVYQSLDSGSQANDDSTLYTSAVSKSIIDKEDEINNPSQVETETTENADEEETDEHAHLKNIYSSSEQSPEDDEIEISDTEPDENCYIVYSSKRSTEPIFLTVSSNFLREKDTITQRTKTKWSIKILESCERLKSNMLRINFDTVKQDKQERVYTVEDDLCQELERKLRAILSERDLTEMNIIIYRCVNCGSQFTREHKQKHYNTEPRCPDCRSTFVAEIHDIPKSLDKPNLLPPSEKLSPAAIVEESPISTPLIVQTSKPPTFIESSMVATDDDNNSIARLIANNTTTKRRTLMPITKSSANSLNESSSCSKITNSQCSYDSNQSVVGSSNTERELEFRTNCCESDVDIISNPSQSSIEVLDQNSSRQASEERPIPTMSPTLDNIEDRGYTQSFIEREFGRMPAAQIMSVSLRQHQPQHQHQNQHRVRPQSQSSGETPSVKLENTNVVEEQLKLKSTGGSASSNQTLTNLLTESSSSGSITDSVCTTYEQTEKQKSMTPVVPETTTQASSSSSVGALHNQQLLEAERVNAIGSTPNAKNAKQVSSVKDSKKNVENETNGIGKKEDAGLSSMFGALFQSTNMLMSSSKKLIDAEATANIKTGVALPASLISQTANKNNCQSYKFNYTDFNDIDHRLKLYFYQTKFEEAGEHFKWLARGRIFNEQTQTLCDGLIVMTTCKCYVMEAYAPENDDVAKWLRQVISVTTDRLTSIQLLPWKIGLAFTFRGLGGFLLLLQDILRTDSLLLYFANSMLPSTCSLNYQPEAQILKRLNSAVMDEQIKICSVLNGCQISCDNAKRTFNVCALLATDTKIYLSTGKFNWLSMLDKQGNVMSSDDGDDDPDRNVELCMTQLMSNLVDVERSSPNVYVINFLDETQNICELWQLNFETPENAESCLNAIGQSWEQLFGVPLLSA